VCVLGKVKEESGRRYLSIEDLLEQPKDDKKQVKLCKLNSCMYAHTHAYAGRYAWTHLRTH
jgi:hypothetical protein